MIDFVIDVCLDISKLTFGDEIEIVATFNYLSNDVFNCFQCKKLYPEIRRIEQKGCGKPIARAIFKRRDIHFYKCPSNFYSGLVANLVASASHFDKGILPYKGGLMDQPNKIIEAYSLISSLRKEDEIAFQKKMQSELARKSKRGK